MSIHPEDSSCSDLDRALVLKYLLQGAAAAGAGHEPGALEPEPPCGQRGVHSARLRQSHESHLRMYLCSASLGNRIII
jgi:hypothetical protein